MREEEYKFAGEISIESVEIRSANGTTLDISNQIVEVSIFESMFSATLSGMVTIVDSIGMIAKLPIIGFESLHISLKTPTDEAKQFDFMVYKVDARESINQRSASYVLQIVSYEAFIDQQTSNSKYYFGDAANVVNKIFKDSFSSSTKQVFTEPSSSTIEFILPYWSPFQAINWVASRAISYSGNPTYMFWESTNGFNFKSLDTLSKNEPRITYSTKVRKVNTRDDKVLDRLGTIIDYKVLEFASSLEQISNGAFGSRIFTKDLNENGYIRKNFTGLNNQTLNSTRFKPQMDAFGGSLSGPNSTKVIGTTGRSLVSPDANMFERWALERRAFLETLNVGRLEILTYGSMKMTVGSTVNVLIQENSSKNDVDGFISGRYMVTGINHLISEKNHHMMSLELYKDSFIAEEEKLKLLEGI